RRRGGGRRVGNGADDGRRRNVAEQVQATEVEGEGGPAHPRRGDVGRHGRQRSHRPEHQQQGQVEPNVASPHTKAPPASSTLRLRRSPARPRGRLTTAWLANSRVESSPAPLSCASTPTL